MTKEQRSEYMKKYRTEHREQIKESAQKRNVKRALNMLDHLEKFPNGYRAHMKDGRTFDFIRKFN